MNSRIDQLKVRADESGKRFLLLIVKPNWTADSDKAAMRAFSTWARTNAEIFRIISERLQQHADAVRT